MKPGFALSLSFEGISLLHRAAGGWRRVGDVTLDVPDLSVALNDLRDTALRLQPEGLSCKLIIPNDQIRYLTLETGRDEGEARRAKVRAALDGATPYAVEDLVFDISVEGHLTHVAAVARETLDEAEAFAIENHFNPVSFVAIPGDQSFLGEPFFGATKNAGSTQIEPDGVAVVVTGPAVFPDPEKAAKGTAQSKGAAKPASATQPDTHPKGPSAQVQAPAQTQKANLEPAPPEPAPPAIGFSSRRGKDDTNGAAPALAGASRGAQPDAAHPAPAIAGSVPDKTGGAAPISTPAAPKPASKAVPKPVPGPTATAATATADTQPSDAKADAGKPARGAAILNRAKSRLIRSKPTKPGPKPATPAPAKPASSKPPPAKPAPANPTPRPIAQPPADQGFTAAVPISEPPRDESERMTVFGARPTQRTGGKPRHLGLILTVVLLLFLAAMAAWATLGPEGGFARLFSPSTDRQETATDPAPTSPKDAGQETGPVDTGSEIDSDPVIDTGPAPTQPPLISAVPPQTPTGDLATPAPPALSATDSAVLDALREDSGISQPAALDTTALDVQQMPETGPDLETDLEPEPEAANDLAGNLADSDTLYAATGIWTTAPDTPETPSIIGMDDIYVASIDRTDLSQDAVALPAPRDLATDAALNGVTSPAAAGTAFALDAQGLVAATPEGTVTPDGITVYQGRPPVVPPATPPRVSPADDAAEEADVLRLRLAGFRPRPRPGDLVEQSERTQLGGRSRAELGGLRPRTRPASAQQTAAIAAAVASATAATDGDAPSALSNLSSATAQAVATALTPKARPREFQQTVRNSERASIGIPNTQTAAAAAPATVTPSIPSSASVARQATLDNAINLRRVNLIGVYGTAANRRALVRLASGRYKKVKVGDSIDGGRVLAIGESQLQYQKGGRNHTLKMPQS
ncbi:hypothetical protein [Antarcticimicrobium sediminis]|uniref:Type IV pilus biogenesis protein PilP n=1 Tax=Antarcticimicrobium sediminis TaxID=2546227 RepID=A0A4R5F004_9RHOB|nr:hypothetical protein [Antarcticimicrobium sediminis]TDE40765.1 hypothetical protein E1B25_00670 [Antarcticimicrobium sediminis]